MKLNKPRFIIEGFLDDGNDGLWETIAYCDNPIVARHALEAADNFLKHHPLEVSERQSDGSYQTISIRTLDGYQ